MASADAGGPSSFAAELRAQRTVRGWTQVPRKTRCTSSGRSGETLTDNWRKSSYSGGSGGECAEAGTAAGMVLVRDTKNNGDGPVLRVSTETGRVFTTSLRATPRD